MWTGGKCYLSLPRVLSTASLSSIKQCSLEVLQSHKGRARGLGCCLRRQGQCQGHGLLPKPSRVVPGTGIFPKLSRVVPWAWAFVQSVKGSVQGVGICISRQGQYQGPGRLPRDRDFSQAVKMIQPVQVFFLKIAAVKSYFCTFVPLETSIA